LRELIRNVCSADFQQERLARSFLMIAGLGYFAFIALYSYKFRNYTCAKAIYIFPGMLAFYYLFAEAYERRPAGLRTLQRTAIALLCCLYVADILVVIQDVIHRLPGKEFFF
jgi:tRNA U34 5-methylaminomethyl-2-thiouridine-forming methyltransferase MnmC